MSTKRAKNRPDLRLLPTSPQHNFRIRRRRRCLLFRLLPRLTSLYRCRTRDCLLQHRDMYRLPKLRTVSTLHQLGLPAP